MARPKITVTGTGMVATMLCHWLAIKNLGDICLLSRSEKKAKGLALDIQTAAACFDGEYHISGTADVTDTAKSDICIITSGLPRKEGMSRDDLLQKNKEIVSKIAKDLVKHSPETILIIVTNPLDAMVYSAWKETGLPRERILGMAGMLDTARFKTYLAKATQKDVKQIDAIVLGSHGDNMVPLVSRTTVEERPLSELLEAGEIEEVVQRTRSGGHEIIELQGCSASSAPGASVAEMVESILKDQKRILPCCCLLDGEYGEKGIFMGVPARLGRNGVEEILEIEFTDKEQEAWSACVQHVRTLIQSL